MEKLSKYNGRDLNLEIINLLKEDLERLFKEGELTFNNGDKENCISKGNRYIVNVAYVKKEYDALMALIETYLGFYNKQANEIYEIPGVKITINNEEYIRTIYIPADIFYSFASHALEFEEIFNNELKIEFPDQVYQQLHSTEKIPGLNCSNPNPKLYSETYEEYEASLESFYKVFGVKKEMANDRKWRLPYPHEKINYKDNPYEIDNNHLSSYYVFANERARQSLKEKKHGIIPQNYPQGTIKEMHLKKPFEEIKVPEIFVQESEENLNFNDFLININNIKNDLESLNKQIKKLEEKSNMPEFTDKNKAQLEYLKSLQRDCLQLASKKLQSIINSHEIETSSPTLK